MLLPHKAGPTWQWGRPALPPHGFVPALPLGTGSEGAPGRGGGTRWVAPHLSLGWGAQKSLPGGAEAGCSGGTFPSLSVGGFQANPRSLLRRDPAPSPRPPLTALAPPPAAGRAHGGVGVSCAVFPAGYCPFHSPPGIPWPAGRGGPALAGCRRAVLRFGYPSSGAAAARHSLGAPRPFPVRRWSLPELRLHGRLQTQVPMTGRDLSPSWFLGGVAVGTPRPPRWPRLEGIGGSVGAGSQKSGRPEVR